MNEIILIGGGGHCRSCIDVLETSGKFRVAGIVDRSDAIGSSTLAYPVIATDDELPSLAKTYRYFFITLGQIKSAKRRIEIYAILKNLKVELPSIISPLSHVSRHASIGEGTIIMHHCVVNSNARIGANSIINTHAIIEHDCIIGDHCHISTGVICNGGAMIKDECFIGSGSILKETIVINRQNIIAAGSVIIKNCKRIGIYAGNPAQQVM